MPALKLGECVLLRLVSAPKLGERAPLRPGHLRELPGAHGGGLRELLQELFGDRPGDLLNLVLREAPAPGPCAPPRPSSAASAAQAPAAKSSAS